MEKRINTKVETYIGEFKTNICERIKNIHFDKKEQVTELLQYVYDYDRICLTKDDFIKRKRIKNAIPVTNRCNAMRANDEQCTRRRKDGSDFCGTHSKGTPHGMVSTAKDTATDSNKLVDVFAKEVMGIVYYIDNFYNVYNTEDVMNGVENPKIIAKYVKNGENVSIPLLGLG
jgi:hypothetical protein